MDLQVSKEFKKDTSYDLKPKGKTMVEIKILRDQQALEETSSE